MNRATLILAALALLSLAPWATAGPITIVDLQPDTTNYSSGHAALDGTISDSTDPNYPGGSFVYASSFVFTGTPGTVMTTVGMYMVNIGENASFLPGDNSVNTVQYPGTPFQFEVLADNDGTPGNVLATTTWIQDGNTTSFALVTGTLNTSISLGNDNEYWIAVSTVGQASQGAYAVGVLNPSNGVVDNDALDNGTFWYSNDPTGQLFDGNNYGQGFTPELAIFASGPDTGVPGGAVPEPATLTLLSIGIACMAGYGWRRCKRATG